MHARVCLDGIADIALLLSIAEDDIAVQPQPVIKVATHKQTFAKDIGISKDF